MVGAQGMTQVLIERHLTWNKLVQEFQEVCRDTKVLKIHAPTHNLNKPHYPDKTFPKENTYAMNTSSGTNKAQPSFSGTRNNKVFHTCNRQNPTHDWKMCGKK